jgi:hypothetical protein
VNGGRGVADDGHVTTYTGNTGTIKDAGKDSRGILHETLHLMGLSDRYDEYRDNLRGGKAVDVPHKGFEKDIMADGTKFNSFYHILYKDLGVRSHQLIWINSIPMHMNADRNTKGSILTPNEPGGVHTNHNDEND